MFSNLISSKVAFLAWEESSGYSVYRLDSDIVGFRLPASEVVDAGVAHERVSDEALGAKRLLCLAGLVLNLNLSFLALFDRSYGVEELFAL